SAQAPAGTQHGAGAGGLRPRSARGGRLRPGVRRTAAEAGHSAADREPARAAHPAGGIRPRRPDSHQRQRRGAEVRQELAGILRAPGWVTQDNNAMPFYEYECASCKFYTEVMQKISDAPLEKCPSCGKKALKKLVSAPVFRLKGGGWYETDFKSDKEAKRNIADREEPAGKSGDTKPAPSGESAGKTASGSGGGSSEGAAKVSAAESSASSSVGGSRGKT